jgi:Skp family chaperone for outer membrane proteins
MKKLLLVCVVVAAGLLFTNTTKAQAQKIGYFDEQLTLSWFPGLSAKYDTVMFSYQQDSLGVEYQYRVNDFKRKDSIFRKDSLTMPAKARELALKELGQMQYTLQNWQQYAEEMARNKQEQFLAPYKQKMFEALKTIIAEQKYTYVLNAQALSMYAQPWPILDNLSIRVALKLKLPLPKDYEDAWKAAIGGGATPPSGAAKK